MLYLKDVEYLGNGTFTEEVWSCELSEEDRLAYGFRMLEVEGVAIETAQVVSGYSELRVSEAMLTVGKMSIPSGASVDIVPLEGGRRLTAKTGTLKTLVVRVVANGTCVFAC
jgi:hypothetical protein